MREWYGLVVMRRNAGAGEGELKIATTASRKQLRTET